MSSYGKRPKHQPARIIKIIEFDSCGNELAPVYLVVEGTNNWTILYRCQSFDEAKHWVEQRGYTLAS